ncbi:MAG TPA: secretin N-terminal domain-containing protein [Gemmatimonadaceae bacterium]|jgi:general secretion pathway protein D
MSTVVRILIYSGAVAAAAAFAQPAMAQRGTTGTAPRPKTPPPKVQARLDTTRRVTAPAGVALDFQDQDLKVVLDAIAAAGDLNVSLTNIPAQRVTLHLGRPVSRDSMAALIRTVAESNGLRVTSSANIIEIAGTAPVAPVQVGRGGPALSVAQQLAQLQQSQQAQMKLFTYRLKHASAVQLAPVLTNLFAGYQGQNTRITIPNGNGGFTVLNSTAANGPVGAAAGGAPGVTNIPAPFGGGGGGGGGRGGGRGGGAAAQAAQVQALAAVSGALSAQTADIRIIAEASSNSLLIRATDADYALIQQIVSGIDLRPLQVLIEVTIAEVERTHDFDLGVSGNITQTAKNGRSVDSVGAPSTASARDFIVALTGGHGTINYNVAMAALQERGDVRVLSLPVIIAQNNQQAVLNVGSSRPFVQVSQTVTADPTARVETVQYIDVGTVLTITPTINPDGYVNLAVSQTDNSASDEVEFDAPVINKREATTQIFIRDGQTTVIGGLAGKSHNSDISGVPLLSRIPFFGPLLFGRTTTSDATTELFLFLTPHVIYADSDVDKLRDAVQSGSDLLKDVPITSRIIPKADTLTTKSDSAKRPPQWR